ncbi:MAG TPA: hypothetical protein VK821_00780 [Dehalococcoidia bacterium]|nr:hypothetical protein [Dehalococcoidia bacterium]
MAADTLFRHEFGRLRQRFAALSIALGVLATAALSAALITPAAAQTPQLVTNPDGSVSYVTAANGSALVSGPGGASYITANGSPTLITNPNGSVSYASVNGGPSLVEGPDGSFSYQNVIAGATGIGEATLAYVGANNLSGSAGLATTAGLNPLGPQTLREIAPPGRIPLAPRETSGRYCDLPDGGQVWVDYGAPSGLATCSS